jgi:hypothetical protein
MPRDYKSEWSSELISRVSSFVDAYVLFEKVALPERYKKYKELQELDPEGVIFEFIRSDTLRHSDDLVKGITLDLSLNMSNLESLLQEDYKWFSQHDGNVSREEYESIIELSSISMAHLRLWQLGLVNEIADNTKASVILPLSLQGLENEGNERKLPFHVDRLSDLNNHFQGLIRSITASTSDVFIDYLNNVPPLFTLLVDQVLSYDHAIEVLKQLRKDYSRLRALNIDYQSSIEDAGSNRDKKDIIDDWNKSWDLLLKGDFRKPQFLRKKISSSDISKSIVKPHSSGLSTLIHSYLDYREERHSYNRFMIYSELYNELDGVSGSRKNLESKFSVNLVNEL